MLRPLHRHPHLEEEESVNNSLVERADQGRSEAAARFSMISAGLARLGPALVLEHLYLQICGVLLIARPAK